RPRAKRPTPHATEPTRRGEQKEPPRRRDKNAPPPTDTRRKPAPLSGSYQADGRAKQEERLGIRGKQDKRRGHHQKIKRGAFGLAPRQIEPRQPLQIDQEENSADITDDE